MSGFGGAFQYGRATNNAYTASVVQSTLVNGEVDAYFIRGDLTLQGQINLGSQKNAAYNGNNSEWWGLSGLAAYKMSPRLELVSRLDYIDNHKNGGGLLQYSVEDGRNGIGPDANLGCTATGWVDGCDKGANRYALAVGVNYLLTPNTTIKAEYRLDRANQPVFFDITDGTYRKSNQLLGASVVVSF